MPNAGFQFYYEPFKNSRAFTDEAVELRFSPHVVLLLYVIAVLVLPLSSCAVTSENQL